MIEPRFVAVHNALSAMGLVQSGPISQGSLPSHTDARIGVRLEEGRCYTFVALGGDRVKDIELSVVDARNEPLARDGTADRQAAVYLCPERSGDYQVVVRMASGHGAYTTSMWSNKADSAVTTVNVGRTACEQVDELSSGELVRGDTRGRPSSTSPSCIPPGSAPEVIYRLVVEQPAQVSLELESDFDGVLSLLDACGAGATLGCNDDFQDTAHARLDLTLQPGTYYVAVDGYASAQGEFTLLAQVQPLRPLAEVCADAPPLPIGQQVSGTTAGSPNYFQATCAGGAGAPDQVHRLDVPQRSRVRVHQHSQHDGALYIRRSCEDPTSELVCNDDFGGSTSESLVTAVLDPGQYFVISDGYARDSSGGAGDYALTAEIAPVSGGGADADACGAAGTLSAGTPVALDTFEAADDLHGSCGGADAPDVVYMLRVDARSTARITLSNAQFEGVIYLRRACGDAATEVACAEVPMTSSFGSQGLLETVLDPGTYAVVVDGREAAAFGEAQLAVQLTDLRALDRTCRTAPLLRPGRTVNGSTAGRSNDFEASCAGNARSGDAVYRLRVTRREHVVVDMTSDYDGALYLRRTCTDRASELACNDDHADQRTSHVEADLEPGTYFVVVDGFGPSSSGGYSLRYASTPLP
jgi:hypothetical protein